ncbi:MAG: M6 family metalloprotease domain-containing protein [Candidatus Cloacimonetes bacterium]|nr:M6 family metalloprotease domain-containing protein [Candidatus Cloacimonadota bacterium]
MQLICIEKRAKTLVIRDRILFILFMSLFIILNAAWLENIPTVLTQPDETQIEAFLSGDEFHNWAHDEDGFTIILDPVTGFWCWAIAEDGDLVSTGQPIHIVSRETLNISPNENISEDRYRELRLPYDEMFESRNSKTPSTGVVQNLVIFIRFSDQSEFQDSTYQTMTNLFNAQGVDVNSMYQYFYDASYGQLFVESPFFPIPVNYHVVSYQSTHPRNYFIPYNEISNSIGYQNHAERIEREHQLIADAIMFVENQIPTILNIDANNDGFVDNINFVIRGNIHQGQGTELWNIILWPHMMTLYSIDVFIHGKQVMDYNINLEQHMIRPNNGVGVLVHEFAHSIGLPDLYRYLSPHSFRPIGAWDAMSHTSNPPQSISAYMKWNYTNWVSSLPILSTSGTYTLSPITISQTNHAYRINPPYYTDEFYVVEYRNKDTGLTDSTLQDSGLLIYRVNTKAVNGNAYGPPDLLYIYRPGGTLTEDGDLENAFYSLESGRTAINQTTEPRPFMSDGFPGFLDITNIGSIGPTISFYYTEPDFLDFDLLAGDIEGPLLAYVSKPYEYTFRVYNIGLTRIYGDDYSIKLMNGSMILAEAQGVDFGLSGSHISYRDVRISWTPTYPEFYQIHAFIDFRFDENHANNKSNILHILVQDSTIEVYPGDDIQKAIDLCASGGVIYASPGVYGESDEIYLLNGKDISFIGITKDPPVTIKGRFEISDVTNYTVFENLVFEPDVTKDGFVALNLTMATPQLRDLTFILNTLYEATGINYYYDAEHDNVLEISNTEFYGKRGVSFFGRSSLAMLHITHSDFYGNYSSDIGVGSAVDFIGTHIMISDSNFYQDTSVYLNESVIRPAQTINVFFVKNYLDYDNELIFKNNKFITELAAVPLYAKDIVVNSQNDVNILNFERNIFSTTRLLGTTQANSRIVIEDSPNLYGNSIRLINNTDVFFGSNPVYNFLEHNVELLSKNNLLSGAILTNPFIPSATNEIYYSWFVNPNQQNFPPNATTDYLYYGDPEIDEETFHPLWTETVKSGLIDAGDPDTNDNGIKWLDDPEDQDLDGTRLDIGAVPTIPHGYIRHRLTPAPIPSVDINADYHWISFPYIDKLFQGTINDRPVDELYYNLHLYNDNSLFDEEQNRVLQYIEWKYNDNEGFIEFDISGNLIYNDDHIIDSKHGYKIKMLQSKFREIIVSGFLAGEYGNEEDIITIEPINSQNQIWVGYFKEQSECPLYALQEIDPWLISIQTQRWTIGRRASQGPWMTSAINPRLNFGDTVVLVAENDVELNFTWQISENATTERYVHPMATFFEYEEQIDYVPVYVYLPDDISIEGIGEIGMFVNSLCIGAEPIMGDMVQINAYILGMDLDDADIEFQYFEYGSRSGVRSIANYNVLDQELQVFQAKSLDLGNGDRFHVVSFNGDDNQLPEIPEKTFLEGNIPNPFNPFTTIRYHLSQQENVSLRIYNIRGQLVKTLVNETQEAGIYSIIWNGDNTRGNRVASGVYFYKFETNNITEVKRMVLLK